MHKFLEAAELFHETSMYYVGVHACVRACVWKYKNGGNMTSSTPVLKPFYLSLTPFREDTAILSFF
jgi:hypothetical protein